MSEYRTPRTLAECKFVVGYRGYVPPRRRSPLADIALAIALGFAGGVALFLALL
jgi:hypothetical protein